MKHTLNYGRITWSYDDFDPSLPCRLDPFVTFRAVNLCGSAFYPSFSSRVSMRLLKLTTSKKLFFTTAYQKWLRQQTFDDRELGEGRAFLRWLIKNQFSINWRPGDYELHAYFRQKNAPQDYDDDDFSRSHSFVIKTVTVNKRQIRLYVPDESVLSLISLPYGEDEDFIHLVTNYIKMRFKWESWQAPSVPFIDWVVAQGKRPIFSVGQLGLKLSDFKNTSKTWYDLF